MIDRAQVQKIALLARLHLTPDEETEFTTQLSSILEYFEQLSELDTEGVLPTTRAIELSNITREDTLKTEINPEDMLQLAPDREESYFKVPQILNSEE